MIAACVNACGGSRTVAAGAADGGADGALVPISADASSDGAMIDIVVDDTAPTGPASHLDVGSNQIYAFDGLTTPSPTAQERLTALSPNLLRLHIHAVGGNLPTSAAKIAICNPPSDTSCNRVPWDFTGLDYLVGDARAAGAEPLMNIALPPPWQWTVTDASTTPKPTGYVTDADDSQHPFAMFASYMGALVQYYNLGRATVTEADGSSHTLMNPHGTTNRITWWELLNEPAITSPANPYQPAGPSPLTPIFTPQQYVAMWNATTAAMLAADPTVRIVGPALPFARTSAGANGGTDYIPLLLEQVRKPDAISFHGYAWVDNTIPDLVAYAGDPTNPSRRGLAAILADLHQVQAWTRAAGVPTLPIWIDEFGFNGFGVTDPHGRPTHAFAAAFTGAAFISFSGELALAQLDEFSFALQSYPDLSLLNLANGRQPVLLYWVYRALGEAFPAGSTVLPVQSSGAFLPSSPGVAAFAVRSPTSPTVAVLLANAAVANAADQGGFGVGQVVHLDVKGGGTFKQVTVQHLDATTDLDAGPATTALAAGGTATVELPGYSLAIVRLAP